MQGKIHILVITETKTDSTFPLNQFAIQEYLKPYRFGRNRNGGGIFIYVWEDIPSKELNIHNKYSRGYGKYFYRINLIKTKWLFCGSYHLPSHSDVYFFGSIKRMLDRYSVYYDNLMLVRDFSAEESEPCQSQFIYNAKNSVKENTCFKSILNFL